MNPTDFVKRLMVVFGEPKTTDAEAFMAECERVLAGFEPAILARAINRVIDNEQFWPRPSELRKHAEAVAIRMQDDRKRREASREMREVKRPLTDAERARHEALMAQHRKFMAAHTTGTQKPTVTRTSRDVFEARQRASQNYALHRLEAAE